MKRKTWYKLHKWIAVGSGVALLIWCISGLALVVPGVTSSLDGIGGPAPVGPDPDFTTVTVSPAEAIAGVAATGVSAEARFVTLRKVGGRMAYDVRYRGGAQTLVDAHTGEPFTVDSTLAVSLARLRAGTDAEVASFRKLTSPTAAYPFGLIPAYMVEFADAPGVTYSTEVATGAVVRMSGSGRLRAFIERTHTFKQLDAFIPGVATHWLLIIFTVATAIAAVMGFWIALPKTWIPVWLGGVSRGRTVHRDEEVSNPAG